MVRRTVLFFALLLSFCALAPAQMPSSSVKEITAWPNGVVNINDGWRFQFGDDLRYAQPGFDDSAWRVVNLESAARTALAGPGVHWFRLHLKLPANHVPMQLILGAQEGGFEVYVNGVRTGDYRIGSPLRFRYGRLHAVALPNAASDVSVAVRSIESRDVVAYFTKNTLVSAAIAPQPMARLMVEAESSQLLHGSWSSYAIDLATCVGGLAAFGLFLAQRGRREYMWLGAYLFVLGFSDLVYIACTHGPLPISVNDLFADPSDCLLPILQIEFTFAFVQRRPSVVWRLYEIALAACCILGAVSNWFGVLVLTYAWAETILPLALAVLVPVVLFVWFRHGQREAGWLVLPSLFPAFSISVALTHFIATNLLQSDRLDIFAPLVEFRVASVDFRMEAVANLVFLLAIGVVMFLRFTRTSTEQARATAELEAAREIQNRLVPMELPEIEGCHVRAAYVPAAEVGGDFFQVLQHEDGSTLIAVGDVSGKGLRAAMTGSLTIGALRTLADEGMSPAKLLRALNRQLVQAGQGGFVTLLCARLSPDGVLTLANAGHVFPYRNGAEVALETGMPLGISMDVGYAETTLQLEPGDSITFLSDGVVEARRADGELFGFERTQAISGGSPQEIADAAQEFGQEDDITVLTLHRLAVTEQLTTQLAAPLLA